MSLILMSAQVDCLMPGQIRPVFWGESDRFHDGPHLNAIQGELPVAGTCLRLPDAGVLMQVRNRFRHPGGGTGRVLEGCWVAARTSVQISPQGLCLEPVKEGTTLAWVTLSDKGYAGRRQDSAGPLIAELIAATLPLSLIQGYLLPDDPGRLRALLVDLALEQRFDLIVTTGGTGVAPRDLTPETCISVIDKRLPGMETAMLLSSLAKTPHAVISRAIAGVLGTSLIINLPGSPKAVSENLGTLLPSLSHTLAKLRGDPEDCASLSSPLTRP